MMEVLAVFRDLTKVTLSGHIPDTVRNWKRRLIMYDEVEVDAGDVYYFH